MPEYKFPVILPQLEAIHYRDGLPDNVRDYLSRIATEFDIADLQPHPDTGLPVYVGTGDEAIKSFIGQFNQELLPEELPGFSDQDALLDRVVNILFVIRDTLHGVPED